MKPRVSEKTFAQDGFLYEPKGPCNFAIKTFILSRYFCLLSYLSTANIINSNISVLLLQRCFHNLSKGTVQSSESNILYQVQYSLSMIYLKCCWKIVHSGLAQVLSITLVRHTLQALMGNKYERQQGSQKQLQKQTRVNGYNESHQITDNWLQPRAYVGFIMYVIRSQLATTSKMAYNYKVNLQTGYSDRWPMIQYVYICDGTIILYHSPSPILLHSTEVKLRHMPSSSS